MDKEPKDALATLTRLRQGALLYSLANAYLCEPVFRKKIGHEMALNLQSLPEEIEHLKRQFPGKFMKEVDAGPILDELRVKVEEFGNPDEKTQARCGQGELGRELELGINTLTVAVHAIRDQVEGKSPVYTSKEAVSMAVDRGTTMISEFSRKIVRPLAVIVAALILVFGYLFFTMEREEDVRNQITAMEALVQSSRKTVSELDREKAQISRRIQTMKARELAKAEKIDFMDLGQQLLKIEERQREADAEIETFEKKIQSRRATLQEMTEKSLLARMLRM